MSLKDALNYGGFGWAVFPLLPRSKVPSTERGFHDAAKDEETIKALWGANTNLNIGIATGDVSGIWVLDIDPDKGGDESLSQLENKYGSLPETLVSYTGGGGKHYIFKIPRGIKIPCTINKLGKGIDTRGTGGYIAAPPSVHPSGNVYTWGDKEIVDAPQWLIKLIQNLRKDTPKPALGQEIVGDWTADDVVSMLECIDPDERDTWIQVGMALHAGGWPATMWDTWSRGSPKYRMGEPFRKWAGFNSDGGMSFGSLVYMAQQNGWMPKEKPYEEIDISNISGVDLSEFKNNLNIQNTPKVEEFETKMAIGGLVGDTLSWINSTAMKLQPELTVMNILAALGAVFGRRYALQKLNTRTNIYMVGIAETGQGKDHSRQQIKRLFKASGLNNFCGPDEVRSDTGLKSELKQHPSLLVNIDEMGMFMRGLFDPKSPAYIRNISTMFTKLYSCSGSSYDGGIIGTKPDERTTLHEPNLCIYGTTTLSSYAEAMRSSAIKSGELNRFIVLKSAIEFPEPNFNCGNSEPPETLVSRWGKFKVTGLAAAPDLIEQKKIIVTLGSMDKEVDDLFRFQDSMCKKYHANGTGALWVRYRENILKIAMIMAIARNPEKPELIQTDIDFGKSLVGASINFMMQFAANTMYDGDFQKKCMEFLEAFDSGANTRSKMLNRLRIETRKLDDIERALKEMGKIDYDEKERPKRYFLK